MVAESFEPIHQTFKKQNKMVKNLLFFFALLISMTASAQKEPKSTEQFINEIDKKIPQLLNDFLVPGAAIAIIDNGEIILQKGYGFADVEKGIKVNEKTGFNIGSISKTIAAWGVMKLVQEGKIDLDAPAERYLTRWKLPESEFDSKEVTIRRLLSHTGGLSLHGYPGWSPNDTLSTIVESLNGRNNGPGRVEIIMEPGTKYKYSGGGFTILQLIIKEVTGQKFEDYMQTEVLNPLGMTNSSYKIDDKIMTASSLEYDNYGESIDFELFTAQAAAGLHITIEDFTRFAFANLYRHKDNEKNNPVLLPFIIQEMMEPVPLANGRFGYGLGYMTESIPGTFVQLAGHRGANTGWHAIFNVNPKTNDGFIMVTNGGSGQRIYSPIFFDWALWKLDVTLEDWYNSKPSVANKLKAVIDSKGIDEITTIYTDLKENQSEKYDFSESRLNELGYHYLGKDEIENALAVFKLNVEAFPNAFNVYDSYGEALLVNGDKEQAIENYKKSVELNPDNEHGVNELKKLGIIIPKKDFNLLEADSAWGQEIFYFPISFAPDLNYKGFEDARFPKGWGNTESDEFWSYTFAWSIDLNTTLTEKDLQNDLQIYFDGLSNVVNKDKGKELPKTIAQLHKKPSTNNQTQYKGTVDIYDAFKTKKPLKLNVVIEKYDCLEDNKTIIHFKFSPKDFENDVWNKLNGLRLRGNLCD